MQEKGWFKDIIFLFLDDLCLQETRQDEREFQIYVVDELFLSASCKLATPRPSGRREREGGEREGGREKF